MSVPDFPAMVVLRPGDKVLVSLVDDPEAEVANEYAASLHEAFPGVEFVILGGAAGIAVLHDTSPPKPFRRVG